MGWTIYCHVHVESGRLYVGLTKMTVLQRWNRHVYNSNRTGSKKFVTSHFANAIRVYGKDAFTHHVLGVCHDLEEANLVEEVWIFLLNTRDPQFGFNIAKGGSHAPHPIRNPWDRPEYREKAVAAAKAKWKDPEFRSKQEARDFSHLQSREARGAASATRSTPESKVRRVAASKAVLARPDVREKLSAVYADPERLKAMSEASKAAHARPDVKARVAAASRASNARPEVKARISSSSKALWRDTGYASRVASRTVSDETRSRMSAASSTPENLERLNSVRASRDPEVRSRISASLKATLDDPERKARLSEISRSRWEDPAYRARMTEVLSAANAARPVQTRCKRGHSMEDARVRRDGRRLCRICSRLRKASYRASAPVA